MKTALITGASRGLGQEIAQALGRNGFFILGTSTSQEGLVSIENNFKSSGISGKAILLDLGTTDLNDFINASVYTNCDRISVLVNNAGICDDSLFMTMKDDQLENLIDINLVETLKLTKLIIPNMMKMKYGRIVNIGSVVSRMGARGLTHYAASKAALEGFTRSLALEVARWNITVNVVSPGFINTDMTEILSEKLIDEVCSKIPLHRLGETKEVAAVVRFLASEEASYITGETINVNGGLYMG